MTDRLSVGVIGRPQGLKGEMRLTPTVDSEKRFDTLSRVFIDGSVYAVTAIRHAPNGLFITLEGVTSREDAALFNGKILEIERGDAVKDDDRFFIVDVIGCKVALDDGRELGTIKDVLQYGAADVLVVDEEGGRRSMLPFIDRLVKDIDIGRKKIVFDACAYGDLAVYED